MRRPAGFLAGVLFTGVLSAAAPAAAAPVCAPPPSPGVALPASSGREPTIDRLGLTRAWQLSTGAGVTVSVVDSGVDVPGGASGAKPALGKITPALVPGVQLQSAQVSAGYLQTPGGTGDCVGHGTAVAALIAARPGDDDRVVGVAPAARIASIRILGDIESAPDTELAAAIRAGADRGQVLNLSWRVLKDYPSIRAAIRYALRKNVVVVAAAPNEKIDPGTKVWPAAYPGVLTVAALHRADSTPMPANQASWIGIAAPGESITTLAPISGYQAISGTSMATALVSGVAALVRSRFPQLSAPEVVRRLTATAVPLGSGPAQVGAGMVDPIAALTAEVPAGAPPSATRSAAGSVPVQARPAPPATLSDRWGHILAWGGVLAVAAVLAYLARLAVLAAIRRRWRPGGGPSEDTPYEPVPEPPNVRLV